MAPTSSLALLYTVLLGLAVVPYVKGHGADLSLIPEGKPISEDPIVCS